MNRPTQPLPLYGCPPARRFDAGGLVFAQGDVIGSLHVVRAGLVRLAVHSSEGRIGVLDVLGPGDVFGEAALLGPAPSPIEVRAVTECRVAPVPPEVRPRDVAVRLAVRLARASESLAASLVLDAPARLERMLVDLSERHGVRVAGGVRIDLPLTQSELAAMIGVSRETVNRAVGSLVARGWLRVRGRQYTVFDEEPARSAAS